MHIEVRLSTRGRFALAVLALGAAVAIGWWLAEDADASGETATITACVSQGGTFRMISETASCPSGESRLTLATGAGVATLHNRVASLEATNSALQTRVRELDEANQALQTEVDALDNANLALTRQLAPLEDQVDDLQELLRGVRREQVDGRDTLQFSGMNLQIINGLGRTDETNGLGNLIVGYNAQRSPAATRTGSHYVVVGDEHEWTAFGGMIGGLGNTATGPSASVLGGVNNTAAGHWSSVSGGERNTTSASFTSVLGGRGNVAGAGWATVSGGQDNRASGSAASVSGGLHNTASAAWSSISGGDHNRANIEGASVLGGRRNTVIGSWSTLLGGLDYTMAEDEDCIPDC